MFDDNTPNIVTLDGARGTGKTNLSRLLRDRFGCGVVEIGPLFRLIAFLMTERHTAFVRTGLERLEAELENGRIDIWPGAGGDLTAMLIEVDGRDASSKLWDTRLDPLISSIAADTEVARDLAGLALRLLNGYPGIVVGRQVGSDLMPGARLKIVLLANDRVRRARKATQMRSNLRIERTAAEVELSEPARLWSHDSDSMLIDTTEMPPSQVFESVSEHVASIMGWDATYNSGVAVAA